MGRLSDFKTHEHSQTENEQNRGEKDNITEKDVIEKYNFYKDMSSAELNGELLKEVTKQKQAGTFDYTRLESMIESLRGSLSEENYQNMKRILESLK